MDIPLNIFDAHRIRNIEPNQVNTGFIWGQLYLKRQGSENKEIYSKLLNRFEDFMWQYSFLLDENPRTFTFSTKEEVFEFWQRLEKHPYFKNHCLDLIEAGEDQRHQSRVF